MQEIRRRLQEENTFISARALYSLLWKFSERGMIADLPKRKRARALTQEMITAIDEELRKNDELTSTRIRAFLLLKWPDVRVSIPTIKRVRKEIGWVCTRPHYCQLLRDVRLFYNNMYFTPHMHVTLYITKAIIIVSPMDFVLELQPQSKFDC